MGRGCRLVGVGEKTSLEWPGILEICVVSWLRGRSLGEVVAHPLYRPTGLLWPVLRLLSPQFPLPVAALLPVLVQKRVALA